MSETAGEQASRKGKVKRDGCPAAPAIWHGGPMRSSVTAVHRLVAALEPRDDLEAQHQTDTLRWLEDTDDVFRRSKPAIPDPHLVSYVVMVDPDDGSSLLVDHISAGLWLPPGGHVEPDEHPADTARRELQEELGVDPASLRRLETPTFLTRHPNRGAGARAHRREPVVLPASQPQDDAAT